MNTRDTPIWELSNTPYYIDPWMATPPPPTPKTTLACLVYFDKVHGKAEDLKAIKKCEKAMRFISRIYISASAVALPISYFKVEEGKAAKN